MNGFAIYSALPWWLQNVAFSAAGGRLKRQRYGPLFWQSLEQALHSEWQQTDSLRASQIERLQIVTKSAGKNCSFYQSRFRAAGFDPERFDLECFTRNLPILTKDEVRANSTDLINRFATSPDLIPAKTSGTTGKSLHLIQSRRHIAAQWAVWWRHRLRFGVRPGDSYANFAGRDVVPTSQIGLPAWRRNVPMRQTYFSIFHLTDANLDGICEYLSRNDYDYVSGYPSALAVVARRLLDLGHQLLKPPRAIFSGAETLLASHRELIARGFGARVADQYGASEGCANISECELGRYHIDADFSYVELVPVAPGSNVCRVVGTSFFNDSMPLIRYDTGDTVTVSDERCPCGRSLPVVAKVDGRLESVIHTPDGRHVGRLDFVFKDTPFVEEAQIVQEALAELLVRIVRGDGYDSAKERIIENNLSRYLGSMMRIRFEYVDRIEREANGKFRAVVSHLAGNIGP